MEYSKKFTTKYDDESKTVEMTSVVDANIDSTIKSSTKTLETSDYSHLDFGEPIDYEFTNLIIRDREAFEKEKKKLFENPETKHSVDDEPWNAVEGIPAVAKIGDKIKIKLGKKSKEIMIVIGNYIQFDRENQYDPKSKNILQLKPSVEIEDKNFNKTEIEIELGEIQNIRNMPTQLWEKGEYLIEVVCTGDESQEQTQYTRIMKLHG